MKLAKLIITQSGNIGFSYKLNLSKFDIPNNNNNNKQTKMVEETLNNNNPNNNNNYNRPKTKSTDNNGPKSVYSWNVTDVQKWFSRRCCDYYPLYADKFILHDITGRALIRINDNSLLRLGITDVKHRETIWREILKLRLKTDIMEIRDLQRRNTNNMFYDYSIA